MPLESRTVRYIDNFSVGTRGAASAEYPSDGKMTQGSHRPQASPPPNVAIWRVTSSTHHYLIIISFQSPTLSFIPDLKPSFSANPFHCSLSFSS